MKLGDNEPAAGAIGVLLECVKGVVDAIDEVLDELHDDEDESLKDNHAAESVHEASWPSTAQ